MFSLLRSSNPGLTTLTQSLLYGSLFLAGTMLMRGQMPVVAPPAPPRHHSLSLDAQSVANGGKADTTAESKHGSYGGTAMGDKRVVKSQQNVQFTVKNFAALPDNCTVEWYFFASPVGINGVIPNKEYLLNKGTQDYTVEGAKSISETAASKEIGVVTVRTTESTARVLSLVETKGGAVVQGWVVRLIVDGHISAVKGSSQKFEDIAKDDAKLNALASTGPAPDNSHAKAPNAGHN